MAIRPTGPEAINAELKGWVDGVIHLHTVALKLKLRAVRIAELTALCSAMNKTTVQTRNAMVLTRKIESWNFCADLVAWRLSGNERDTKQDTPWPGQRYVGNRPQDVAQLEDR